MNYLNKTIETASLSTLSPNTSEYSVGSALISFAPRIESVATGSTAEMSEPNNKLFHFFLGEKKKKTSTNKKNPPHTHTPVEPGNR